MKNLNCKNKLAFSLLETIVVLFIISIGLVSILSLTVDSTRAQNLNKNSLVAYNLAAEGLELIKNVRDTNFIQNSTSTPISWDRYIEEGTYRTDWANFQPVSVSNISEAKLQLSTGTYTNLYWHKAGDQDSIFSRLITTKYTSVSSLQVSSLVEWTDQGQTYQVELKSMLYDWIY